MPKSTKPSASPAPAAPPASDEAWTAVVARDARYDGRFVYAVATTKIYCRPTCPSRRPNRGNVAFYAAPDDAERAGYRACLRCRPRSTRPSTVVRTVDRVRELLDASVESPEGPMTLEALAKEVALSPFHLHRMFKRHTGLTPKEYADRRRAELLKTHLRAGDTVTRATYAAGYGSSSRVYESSGRQLGMTPAAYRRGGAGVRIAHTIVDTTFGRLLVGATERGVCAVALGDDDAALRAALTVEYPRATLDGEDDRLGGWVRAIVAQLEGETPRADVPLDVRGTAFQWRVWKALCEIPVGETRSYAEIARAIGQPTAARAVANACANNRVALVVPCHRVVREDGALGGYRWGEERKRRILERERR